RRPGQDPIARLQTEGAQSEGHRARAPVGLAVGPAFGRPILVPDRQRGSIAESGHRVVDQVEQGLHRLRASLLHLGAEAYDALEARASLRTSVGSTLCATVQ